MKNLYKLETDYKTYILGIPYSSFQNKGDYTVTRTFFQMFKKKKSYMYSKYYFLGIQFWCKKKSKTKLLDINSENVKQHLNVQEEKICNLTSKNIVLKNSANKKRCFVLATGPSIKEQDLSLLQGEDSFSISNFFLHKDINIIKPKLHFFAPYHEPLILENYISWLKMADEKLPVETNIVLATSNENLVKEYNLFPNRKIFYLNFGGLRIEENINIDLEYPIMSPQTGPIMMLPVCAYMGYKEIYLVGQDMNRLAYYGATTPNFYDNDPRKNATDPNNWVDIIPELERTLIMFKQFKKYADYFKENSVGFYNLSPTSWLSFIEKQDFKVITQSEEIICNDQ